MTPTLAPLIALQIVSTMVFGWNLAKLSAERR
jgi:hypothetical protein